MRKTTFVLSISILLLTLGLRGAEAGGPVFWRVSTQAEVEKGDAQGISIADNGSLTLAPALIEVFDTKQAYIWSATSDRAGNIYLGTGNEGRIFKVDASGAGKLLYKTPELSVMAMVVDEKGDLYAGTSPDGKVYRITPQGEATVFFEPRTKYIWALAFDRQGRLLVGTGDKGQIFRVDPSGAGTQLVKTTQTSITALRIDGAGNIIAGTDPGGLVMRISPDGRAFTLFDSMLREIRDLAFGGNGEIYALALAESAGSGAASSEAPAAPEVSAPSISTVSDESVTISISDLQVIDATGAAAGASTATSSSGAGQLKSAVYRIDPAGWSDPVWESKDGVAFAILLGDDGGIRVGTGQKGRIYGVAAGQKPVLLAQTTEGQTSRFVQAGGRLYAAASNLGKLFRLSRETAATGTYTSMVRDAQMTAQWGRISWVGEGAIEFQTRSGNTAKPDSTWSDWSAVGSDAAAISSPSARFLQWRANLKAGGREPKLREVTVSYLPRNIAPVIKTLSVLPAGVTLQAIPQPQIDGSSEPLAAESGAVAQMPQIPPRRTFQRGAVSFQWIVEDRNGDTLQYSVFYRNAAGGDFFPLKTELRDNYYTVEPNALPDGRYIFKVAVSDALSNPENLALTTERETETIEIDNTPPVVTVEGPRSSGGRLEVVFRVADATSIIRRAEYQIDGAGWRSVYPVDGIADSRAETFNIPVSLPDRKAHVVAFRVLDANSNVGSARIQVGQP
ncbi:MAG: hypothetical protein IPM66_08390 [Acidobacteriota bacterium]|nr:MAG: hypothetical protein IPM66_08390 [Acidobacteriota bacterium]